MGMPVQMAVRYGGIKKVKLLKQYSILTLRRYIHGVLTYRPTWALVNNKVGVSRQIKIPV